jgi:hypothetical protein
MDLTYVPYSPCRFENYGVFEAAARETVEQFKKPATDCLDSVKRLVEKVHLLMHGWQPLFILIKGCVFFSSTLIWQLIILKDLPI